MGGRELDSMDATTYNCDAGPPAAPASTTVSYQEALSSCANQSPLTRSRLPFDQERVRDRKDNSFKNQMARVANLTRHHWQGRRHPQGGCHSYDRCLPIVATTLDQLREHGPAGPALWRFGRDHRQPLLDAIGNTRRDAYLARRRQAAREEERRRAERMAAEREARPVCKDCGQKFTDGRWEAVGSPGTGASASRTRTCARTARIGPSQPSSRPKSTNASAGSRSVAAASRMPNMLSRRLAAGSPVFAPDLGKPL
ncbi:hypothetical protein GCM10010421_23160 [Streptomyces glaucus]|uniref:Uncharacterized protein n=1 Tax=Streptomyces glaucus TaxID=284029 RepID=A0ABN3JL09_9ACTN